MIISVSTLREQRQNALIRLSKIQSLQISKNNLDYQVESYINLKQLIESNVINKFSLGQLSLIVFNIVVHLIKVYQKIKISQLTLENIIFNQELQVKFINLHEENNLQTYEQNLQIIIVLIQQLFLKYQEIIIEQYKEDKEQIKICKKIELATFYSNKILTLLQSQRHLKQLKLFVQNQVEIGLIKDDLLDDSLTEESEFRNIFSNQLLFNNSQLEESSQEQYNQYQQQNIIYEQSSLQNNQNHLQQKFESQQIQMTHNLQQQPLNPVLLQSLILNQDQNYVSQPKLFEIHQQRGVNLNPAGDQEYDSEQTSLFLPSCHNSVIPSVSEVQKQLQFQQNRCQVNNRNQNVDQSDQIQSKIPQSQIQNIEIQQSSSNNQNESIQQSSIPESQIQNSEIQQISSIHSNDSNDPNNLNSLILEIEN